MRETFAPCLAALLAALCGCRADPDTPLTKAAAAGDAAQVRTVVAGGADVNGMDSRGWAAVHWAARNGELHVLEALIEAGGDVDLKDGGNGWTPLMHAIHKNQVAAARLLLEAGADPNVKTAGGVTSLIMAAGYGQTETVRALLARGADPYAEAGPGITALWAAAGGGAIADITDGPPLGTCFPSTVKALQEKAPDLRLKDNFDTRMVSWLAGSRVCEELVKGLRGPVPRGETAPHPFFGLARFARDGAGRPSPSRRAIAAGSG